MIRIIGGSLILLVTSVTSVQAKNFSEFCEYTSAQQDCSVEFVEALTYSSQYNEPILFDQGHDYLVQNANTTGRFLDGVTLVGNGTSQIFTDMLFLRDISNLSITGLNVVGISVDEGSQIQNTSLVSVGGGYSSQFAHNITFSNNTIERSAEDLISIFNARHVTVSNNKLHDAGLAMRKDVVDTPDVYDERPLGSGIGVWNVDSIVLSYNKLTDIRKVGIYIDSKNHVSTNTNVLSNYIDMLSDGKPTWRYGQKGGAGIYLVQGSEFANAVVSSNSIYNAKMNGLRLNGHNVVAKGNIIDMDPSCSFVPSHVDTTTVNSIAIKSHYLEQSSIESNCIANYSVGIHMQTWGLIDHVTIGSNKVYKPESGIVIEYQSGGVYSNVDVVNNTVFGSKTNGYVFRSASPSHGNSLVGNSLINNAHQNPEGVVSKGPLVLLQRQTGFYYNNNWIEGGARSINWNYLLLENVTNSRFLRSSFKSNVGSDNDFAGVYLKSDSDDNSFEQITFYNLYPGFKDNGKNTSFTNINYESY